MDDGSRIRTVGPRRMHARAAPRGSSADLLLELATRPTARELLGGYGVSSAHLAQAYEQWRDELGPEPADWHHRLSQRGLVGDGDLGQLLAIVRTAESHAYQLLEAVGIPCAQLRRQLIDRARELGASRSSAQRLPPASPPSAPPSSPRRTAGLTRPDLPPGAPRRGVRQSAGLRATEPAVERSPQRRPESRPEPRPEVRAGRTLRSVDVRKLPPLEGRDRELRILADALSRRAPRAPLLVGEHGSGRSLLARHVAGLLDSPVFRLEATSYEDDDELRADLEAVGQAGGIAIFDDLDRIATDTPPPFLAALAQAWAGVKPRVLTVVSHESRARLASWLPGVLDTLDEIRLDPLDPTSAHQAFKRAAPTVLEGHELGLASGANVGDVARLADRYLTGMAMPGRALDLLDLACARARRQGEAELRAETWVEVVCERTGLPRARVEGHGDQEVLNLEQTLARRVVGHGPPIQALASLIRRNRAGFRSGRPIATALLLGPSGIGKTEIAKALASALFERPDALVRLDMSEYAESHAVARVVGAPPGYVGHEQGGALTDPLLAQPHRVVLLDEIEKAHRDVHQLLLQVFDDGRLTDGRGRTVDFRHAIVIMTSNLGASLLESEDEVSEDDILDEARQAFPVELWNRIEAPLVLHPLTRPQLSKIAKRLAKASAERLAHDRGIRYELEDAVVEHLIDLAGEDPSLGARPLRHLLSRQVEARVADAILRGQLRAGDVARVHLIADDIAVEPKPRIVTGR